MKANILIIALFLASLAEANSVLPAKVKKTNVEPIVSAVEKAGKDAVEEIKKIKATDENSTLSTKLIESFDVPEKDPVIEDKYGN